MTARRVVAPSGRPLAAMAIGHRGARAFAPENTVPAIRKAAAMGCALVEVDVHLSADGVPVVHHDDRLARCTDVAERFPGRPDFVSDFTIAELKTLDAGRWYLRELALPAPSRAPFLRSLGEAEAAAWIDRDDQRRYASGTVGIPTLDEVFALAVELDLAVDVEIKSLPRMYPDIAARVVAGVARHGLQASVLVSSFDHAQLVAVRRLDPRIATGALTGDRLARVTDYLASLDADAYLPGCHGDVDALGFGSVSGRLETAALADVRRQGRAVIPWTCNDPAQMQALLDAGVDGIITDYPNRLAAVLAARDPPAPQAASRDA